MLNKKKVLILTERRADYSRFKPILKLIKKDKKLKYSLVVTGLHLLKSHGYTINEIKKDSFNNKEIEFSNYFDDLHDKSYKKIFKNEGYLLQETYESIKLCHSIKKMIKYKNDT